MSLLTEVAHASQAVFGRLLQAENSVRFRGVTRHLGDVADTGAGVSGAERENVADESRDRFLILGGRGA